jgi:RNA polymerase sigma-70 factor, ECF subfamily
MSKVTELTNDGLVSRMIAGDEEAFVLLYRRLHPPLYRFALHMSGNTAVAEDVTQEVFMTLIRDARRFDPGRGTLGGFLYGIARNHLRKRWEQDRRTVQLVEGAEKTRYAAAGAEAGRNASRIGDAAFGDSHDVFASLEAVGRVRQAIATLPENYREVVVLCELEEMNYEEAAAALDCPIGTVRSRLHRARALLLEKLRESEIEWRAVKK